MHSTSERIQAVSPSAFRSIKVQPLVKLVFFVPLFSSMLALAAACGGGGPYCTPSEINAKLKGGGTVAIGSCAVTGTIEVPAGAILKGQGIDHSTISGTVVVHADQG